MLNSNQICPICKNEMLINEQVKVGYICSNSSCKIELEQRHKDTYILKFVLNNKNYCVWYYDHNYKYFELFYYKGPADYRYLYGFESEEFNLEKIYKTSTSFINNLIFM